MRLVSEHVYGLATGLDGDDERTVDVRVANVFVNVHYIISHDLARYRSDQCEEKMISMPIIMKTS